MEDYKPGEKLPPGFAMPAGWPGWQEAARRARLPLHSALSLLPESARLTGAYFYLLLEKNPVPRAPLKRQLHADCRAFLAQVEGPTAGAAPRLRPRPGGGVGSAAPAPAAAQGLEPAARPQQPSLTRAPAPHYEPRAGPSSAAAPPSAPARAVAPRVAQPIAALSGAASPPPVPASAAPASAVLARAAPDRKNRKRFLDLFDRPIPAKVKGPCLPSVRVLLL